MISLLKPVKVSSTSKAELIFIEKQGLVTKGPCPQLEIEAMKATAHGPQTRLVTY